MSMMEITPAPGRFDGDNDLNNHAVVTKYRTAADIANDVMKQVLQATNIGVRAVELCKLGDNLILETTAKMYKKGERGIASPTSVSINHVVRNFSPAEEDTTVLNAGDLVKIDLAVHIDGYIASLSHSTVLSATPSEPTTGRPADAICAAHYGAQAVAKLLDPELKTSRGTFTSTVEGIAQHFGCSAVRTNFTRKVKRFVASVPGAQLPNSMIPEGVDLENIVVPDDDDEMDSWNTEEGDESPQVGDVWVIDVAVSTAATGAVKHVLDHKPMVLKRDVNAFYNLKHKSSRTTLSTVANTFSVFPFATRALIALGSSHRLGMQENLSHNLLVPEWLQVAPTGEFVARFSMTVMLLPSGLLQITAADLPLPYVHSAYDIATSEYAGLINGRTKVRQVKKKIAASAHSAAAMEL